MMKSTQTLAACAAILALGLTSCKGEKETTSTPDSRGEVRVIEYCSGPEFLTNGEFFRASAAGSSPQREIAKKIARQNAEATLARAVEATIEIVAENQATQLGFNTTEEATSKFNELSRTIVNKQLTGAVTICQELTMTEGNKYIAYLAVELSGQNIADAYVDGLKQEERIRAEYNYDEFKETFEEVMSTYRD
ncbi:MAG: hypothetical protein O3B45_05430 [Bacteroidetes bacterium]|nr:hypothetical protein [Bacteroidota bacterium]